MVIGRVVLLAVLLAAGVGLVVIERAVGLPVVLFIVYPWMQRMLPKLEQLILFGALAVVLGTVFALSVSVSSIFLLAVSMQRTVLLRLVPMSQVAVFTTLVTISMVAVFAQLVGSAFAGWLAAYTFVTVVSIGWITFRQSRQSHVIRPETDLVIFK